MKFNLFKKTLLTCLLALIISLVLTIVGCKSNNNSENSAPNNLTTKTESTLGNGKTRFIFTVTDLEGKETAYKINTDKKIVGEALQELGIISGNQGQYGLYVKTVNGITLDFDKDGKYWAFYENGKYANAGVDKTEINQGITYSFKAE